MIHMMKKSILVIWASILMLLAVDPALADAGKVKGASLVMRQEPNRSAKALYTLEEGALMEILGKDDGWYKVRYGKLTGFVDAKYVTVTDKDDDETLRQGDWGSEVRNLQQRLKELGYFKAEADGDYGAKTAAAVKAFQQKNGLNADGVAGPTTMKKLNDSAAEQDSGSAQKDTHDTLRKGASGADVRKLQQRLKELGYFAAKIDGDYGDKTVNAVKAFQQKNGLTADGVAGPSTQKKLYASSAINAKGASGEIKYDTLRRGDQGSAVEELQQRLAELHYFAAEVDGNYGERTVAAVKAFQEKNDLTADGVAGSATLSRLYSDDAVEAIPTERLDWFNGGQTTFPRRAVIQVKDVRTGLIFSAQVLYGSNHLDAEPLTKEDTAILLKINGGSDFSWRRRPMLVKYKGHVYAASIYSEPHGEQLIFDNDFDGQFCLHFYGSMTHGTDEVKLDHQECIEEAMCAVW